ncbi:hypothetical protein Y1Q_0020622 [Alligator mississippiensis]|uniref:Ig-like domain-containing protein n=1 Tax=Alligator mississippiensis TaxID=8496 RepID=A0A151MVX1_ALLMI|nr:hypothetical protein Y1Q_0020622 [Alligator mississippiensis]
MASYHSSSSAFSFWKKRSKGWAVSYSVSEVQGSEQGQEVTLRCSMEGTLPEDVDVTWERIHSEDRTVPESAGDQDCPEHQPLFSALPPGWRVTEERARTRLTSYMSFSSTVQDNRARVWYVFLQAAKQVREEQVSLEIWVRGWEASYSVTEVQGSEQCHPGQEVTLHCSTEGTSPDNVAMTCERVDSEDRTVPESAGDQESPEHQALLPAFPQGWRVTKERAGTRLMSSLTFTPIMQGNGAWVQYVLLKVAKQAIGERVSLEIGVCEVQGPERCLLGVEVTLRCSMEGTFPKDVAVTWERIHSEDRTVPESTRDEESPEHQPLFPALPQGWTVTEERAGTHLTSSLTFTPTVQDDGARVRCCFLHETECIREERVSPEIRVWARLQVSEIQVLPEWDPRDKVPFAVQLHNFYPREVPPIQWGWDGVGSWREDPAQIDKNTDGTFTATSVWRVPSRSLTRPELRVRVCVQHGPGEPPSERELSLRAAGLLQPPQVSKISRTKSMATGKGVTLSCCITGHFPGDLSVTWLRRGKGEATAVILRDSAEYRVEPGTVVLARDGKSFRQETSLTRWTSRDQGAEYICRVGHLALKTPIERSSGKCWDGTGQVAVAG